MDHCVSFFQRKNERRLFEVYVTDALKAIAENTGKALHEGGVGMGKRYIDMINENKPPEKEETRTAADIINHIKDKINKLGG